MKSKKMPLLPSLQRHLRQLGENIRLARKRRNLLTTLAAERAGISRQTLVAIEKGSGGVSMGAYACVLLSLGLEKEISKMAADDKFGQKLQDAKLLGLKL